MKWWQIKKRDADLERELRSDLELEVEEQRESGLPPEEARYAARRAFGNPTLIREQTRAIWSWNGLENLLRDLRISIRTLFRSPGFSLIAVLVMALCIGAATSLFTVVRSVLLGPLPFRDPGRLVMLYEHFRDVRSNQEGFNYNPVAPADFFDWRTQTHGFEDMAAMRYWQFNLTGERGELPEKVSARGGSWNLFPLLGVPAAIGRTFTESEDHLDGSAVMLTWNLFERRFAGDASIVGSQIHLDGKPYTVVGVLPQWFTYPDAKIQVWVPYLSGLPPDIVPHHDYHFSTVVARLRPDVSLASALSQVEAVQYRLHSQYLNAPVAEDVAPRTINDDLARDVKTSADLDVCCCMHVTDRLLECRQPAGGPRSSAAKGGSDPGRTAVDAHPRAIDGELVDLSRRRRGRGVVVAGGYSMVIKRVEGSTQRCGRPRRRRCAGIRLRGGFFRGVARRSAAGHFLHRQGGLCGAPGFIAHRQREPLPRHNAQDIADGRDRGHCGVVDRRGVIAQELCSPA
jgi:hypothetical protein